MIENIRWLGHGSFLIQGEKIIYINPWRITRSAFHADIILVSHNHFDHCSVADIEKLSGKDTFIIGSPKVAEQITNAHVMRSWQTMTFDRIAIKTIPAYSPDGAHHPASDEGLGFIISMNYYDIYYAGDTKLIPEFSKLHPDIAILPIDGNDTMNVEEAAEAVRILRPQWVYPSNWGTSREGASRIEALHFKKLVADYAEVIVPEKK